MTLRTLFLASAMLALLCNIAAAQGEEKIAFGTNRDGNAEVYVMNPDGTGETRLTENPAFDSMPSWSLRGNEIAFTSFRDGDFEIYVMNADGTGQANLTNHPGSDSEPSWSPDGTRIAFVSGRENPNGDIFVMNTHGSEQTNLTNSPAGTGNRRPSWSPDGSRIVFSSNRDGNGEVHVMNADGTGLVNLSNHPASDSDPNWSPDGSRIAFVSNRDGNAEIYVMNADGTGQTNLTRDVANDDNPDWSPNGQAIAFVRGDVFHLESEIYVMQSDGSAQTRVTDTDFSNGSPDWGAVIPSVDIEEASGLEIVLLYNGSPPSATGATFALEYSLSAGPGAIPIPIVDRETILLDPGVYDLLLRFQGQSGAVFEDRLNVADGGIATETIDVTPAVGVLEGAVTANGNPPGVDTLSLCVTIDQELQVCRELPAEGTFRLLLPAGEGQAQVLTAEDAAKVTAPIVGTSRQVAAAAVHPLAHFNFTVTPGVTTQAHTD